VQKMVIIWTIFQKYSFSNNRIKYYIAKFLNGFTPNLNTMKKTSILSLFCIYTLIAQAQNLVINELMSSNNNFLLDEDGDDSDWIELYNNSPNVINLNNYYLSDKSDSLNLWAFPNLDIPPFEWLIVFASGKNKALADGELHTNFSVKADGESIFLSHNETVVHTVSHIALNTNTSYGLSNDGAAPFVVFNTPTPSFSNNNSFGFETITFSHKGGIYEASFELSINANSTSTIRYTTDGTTPTNESFLYNHSVYLDNSYCSQTDINQIQIYAPDEHQPPNPNAVPKSVVIRAAAFNEQGEQASEVVTHSYFIKALGIDHASLPIVSICADHDDLFNYETGIFVPGVHWESDNPKWTGNYYQRGSEWEIPIHLEFYEPSDSSGFRQDAGMRTHGGNARRHPQKGLRLYARSEYGNSYFNHSIFPDRPMTSYKRLVLKSFASSWSHAGIEDYLTGQMIADLNIDGVAMRPVILYINGEYWGLYYLQEKIDERYLEANYGVSKENVDLIEDWGGGTVAGSFHDFNAMYNFFSNNDLSNPNHYDSLSNWMDIDNFIDYQLFQIFIANKDWPTNNMKCWRPRNAEGKWRWIFFDGDAGLEKLEHEGYSKALDMEKENDATAHVTLFLRKLLEHPSFKTQFFNRLEELLNTSLNYQNTEQFYQHIVPIVGQEIDRQINRFEVPSNYDFWSEKLNNLQSFLSFRACEMQEQAAEHFNISIYQQTCNLNKPGIQNMFVYPNPTNGNFILTFDSPSTSAATIFVTNILGQIIHTRNTVVEKGSNTLVFDIEELPNGILSISIFSEDDVLGTKMIYFRNRG